MKIQTHKPDGLGMGYYVAELEVPEPQWSGDLYGKYWYTDIDEWCTETFGEQDAWGSSYIRSGWKHMRNKYFFNDEDKLSWFVLRWS